MTNNASISVTTNGKTIDELAIMVDGMASGNGIKNDKAAKLRQISKNIILTGSGRGDIIDNLAYHLTLYLIKHPETTVEEAAHFLFENSSEENIQLPKDDGLNMTIAGIDPNGEIKQFHIIGRDYVTLSAGTPTPLKRSIRRSLHVLDGSGSVYSSIAAQYKPGFPIKSLTDALNACFDFSMEATTSDGVNDKFQVALLSKGKLSIVYGADIVLSLPGAFEKYVKTMLNVNLPTHTNGQRITAASYNERNNAKNLLDDVYRELFRDLQIHQKYRDSAQKSTPSWLEGDVTLTQMTNLKTKYLESKADITRDIHAITKGGKQALEDYLITVNKAKIARLRC